MVYGIRLLPTERQAFERAAREEGVPLATWLRRAARRELERHALSSEKERRRRVRQALAALGSLSEKDAARLRQDAASTREGWRRGDR